MDAAASLLGMTCTHLARLCDESRVESIAVGSDELVTATELRRVLSERRRADEQAAESGTATER